MFEGKEIKVQKIDNGFAITHEDGRIYTERDIRGLQVHVANALCCASLIEENSRATSVVTREAYHEVVIALEKVSVQLKEEQRNRAIALQRLNDAHIERDRLEEELALARKTNVHHHHITPKQETGSGTIPPRPTRKKKSRR